MKRIILALLCICIFSMCVYADELLISDFTQQAPITDAVYSSDISLLDDETMEIDGSELLPAQYDIPCQSDVSDYKYINLLIYSENESEEDYIQLRFDTTVKKGTKNMYYVYKHKLNYSGFNTVTIALSDFTKYNNVSGTNGWAAIDGKISIIRGNGTKSYCENSKIYLDRMWLSTDIPTDNEFVSCSVNEGETNVFVNNSKVDFTFKNNINKKLLNQPLVTKNGQEVNYTTKIEENHIIFDLGDKLDFKSVYSIEIPEKSIVDSNGFILQKKLCLSFETSEETLICNEITEESGEIKAEIVNVTSVKRNAAFYVTVFDENNNVISCSEEVFEIASNDSKKISVSKPDGENVQAFILDMTANSVVCLNPFGIAPAVCDYIAEKDGVTIDDNVVTVNVSVNPSENYIFTVNDKDGKIYFAAQLVADEEGKSSCKFIMNKADDEGKIYNVSVYVGGKKETYSYYFISDKVKSELLDKSNAVGASQKQVFNEMYQAYGISDEQYENGNFNSQITLLDESAPFESYDNIVDIFNTASDIINKLNNSQWTDVDNMFDNTTYESLLFKGVGEYEKYKSMDDENQSAILKETFVYYPFSDIEEFRTAFKKAYENVNADKNNDNNSTKPVSSGGGGGGSSRSTFAQITTNTVPQLPEAAKPDTEQTFTDLDNFPWAKDSVNRLAQKGVISKASEYRPDDFVTREEFVKMICLAFDISGDSECDFVDVDKEQWYYRYVGALVSIGAVKGYEDNTFGIGKTITRQDMAVIAKRMLDIKGISLNNDGNNSFTDESMIADYAVNSVYAMKNIGVITGMEDGTFAPLDNATRAQTAVIIDRIMNITTKGGDNNG